VFSVLKGFIGMRPYSVSLNGLLVKIYTANLYRMWKMNLILLATYVILSLKAGKRRQRSPCLG